MKIDKRKIWMIPAALLFTTLLVAVVMLLWNWLMPAILGIKAISFWQAAGLLVLSKILFGSWGGHRMGGCHGGNPFRKHNRMHERWVNMTEEERTEFINRRMNHFHHHPFGGKERFGHEFGRKNANERHDSDSEQ